MYYFNNQLIWLLCTEMITLNFFQKAISFSSEKYFHIFSKEVSLSTPKDHTWMWGSGSAERHKLINLSWRQWEILKPKELAKL